MNIFRNDFKQDEINTKKYLSILNENTLFSLRLKHKIKRLKTYLSNDELLNYLFFVLNKYIAKIKYPNYFSILKITYLLWRLKLQNVLNIQERNNLYLFKSAILYKNRLIKTIPVNFLAKNEKVYAEIKCQEILIYHNEILINKFLQPVIYLSNLALILVYRNLFHTILWNRLKTYHWENNIMVFEFKDLKLAITFTDPDSSKILFNRLVKEGYIDLDAISNNK